MLSDLFRFNRLKYSDYESGNGSTWVTEKAEATERSFSPSPLVQRNSYQSLNVSASWLRPRQPKESLN